MKIILIRHGETYSNTLFGTDEQILIGALDNELTKLNDEGKKQAEKARDILGSLIEEVDEIYSSDLVRTRQTTEIVFEGRAYKVDQRIRERSLGILEGMKVNEVKKQLELNNCLPDDSEMETFFLRKHESGENYVDVYNRCKDFMKQFNYDSDKTICIVSHFHTIRCLLYVLMNKSFDEEFNSLLIKNATPYILEYKNGKFECETESFR